MPSSIHRSRSRKAVVAATVCSAALIGGAAPSSAAASARPTCPPGYELGALTVQEARQLPNFVAAFANPEESGFTEEGFLAAFGPGGFFDKNANGILCYKEVAGLNEHVSPYVYIILDDPIGNPPPRP